MAASLISRMQVPELARPSEWFTLQEVGASGVTIDMAVDVSALFPADTTALAFRLFNVNRPDLPATPALTDLVVRIYQGATGVKATMNLLHTVGLDSAANASAWFPLQVELPPIDVAGLAAAQDLLLEFTYAAISNTPAYMAAGILLR